MFLLTLYTTGGTLMQRQTLCQRHLICQLARGAFGFRPGPHYVAMLQAYFDESGHPADPRSQVVSVATVVSTEHGWCAFEDQWHEVLNRYQVSGLHMKHYAHFRGEFSGWTEDKRNAFTQELFSILKQHICFGFGCSLSMTDWNEVMAGKFANPHKEKRGPLMIPFRCCLDAIQLTPLLPQDEQIACKFEWNKYIIGEATRVFEDWREEFGQQDDRFIGFGFLKKGITHRLEAADLLAYEGRKELSEGYVNKSGRPSRQLYKSLATSPQFHFWAISKEGLVSYLKENYPYLLSEEVQP